MVADRDFSGLISSGWALARAAARLPIEGLERCTAILRPEEVKTDCPRLRAFTPHSMADGLLGVLRHQAFEFRLGLLVFQVRRACAGEHCRKLRPGIGRG